MDPVNQIRRVCVITSNRADWSKLRPVVLSLLEEADVEVSVIATGSHLLQEFGQTVNEIKIDFPVGPGFLPSWVSSESMPAMLPEVYLAQILQQWWPPLRHPAYQTASSKPTPSLIKIFFFNLMHSRKSRDAIFVWENTCGTQLPHPGLVDSKMLTKPIKHVIIHV